MAAVAGMSSATVAFAQRVDDKYVESDVVPLAGKEGFSFQTRAGDFLFKPYSLIQVAGKFNYYDDENLNLAEVDRVANSGFAIPNAILGFSGKAFGLIIDYVQFCPERGPKWWSLIAASLVRCQHERCVPFSGR